MPATKVRTKGGVRTAITAVFESGISVSFQLDSQSELAIGGDDNLRDEVRVARERAVGVAVLVLPTLQLPHDDALVARRRHDHVGVLRLQRMHTPPIGIPVDTEKRNGKRVSMEAVDKDLVLFLAVSGHSQYIRVG